MRYLIGRKQRRSHLSIYRRSLAEKGQFEIHHTRRVGAEWGMVEKILDNLNASKIRRGSSANRLAPLSAGLFAAYLNRPVMVDFVG